MFDFIPLIASWLWEVLPVFRMRKEVQAARAWPLETDEAVVKMAGKGRTEAVEALVRKCGDLVERLVEERPIALAWANKRLTAADAPALTDVLKSKALARLETLFLYSTRAALLYNNNLGDEGAAALAAADASLDGLGTHSRTRNAVDDKKPRVQQRAAHYASRV